MPFMYYNKDRKQESAGGQVSKLESWRADKLLSQSGGGDLAKAQKMQKGMPDASDQGVSSCRGDGWREYGGFDGG